MPLSKTHDTHLLIKIILFSRHFFTMPILSMFIPLAALTCCKVLGFYNGAPVQSFDDMIPQHGMVPQKTESRYNLTFHKDDAGDYIGEH